MALVAAAIIAATALAAPGDPTLVAKPADKAYARTIVLGKTALHGTGWKGAATDFGRINPVCIVKHYSLSKLTANAQVGIEYTRPVDTGTFLVDSDAYVFETPAQAATASATVSNLGFGRCLAEALRAETPNGSVATSTVTTLTVSGLAVPAKGYQITVKIFAGKNKSTLTAHVLNMRHGRTVSTLSVLTADKGWSSATLRALAAKVAARTATS